MPPYAFAASPAISIPLNQDGPINAIILQPREHAIEVNLEKTQPATLERVSTGLFPADTSLESGNSKSAPLYRLDVKTHVFKKELQEYVPTRSEERLRIETIIYVELSIVNRADSMLVKNYDYIRFPKDLFCTLPDKVMSPNDMASKRILNVGVSVLCPSNIWQVEKEACVRCARRMSTKLEENESRVSFYSYE
ncbi:hypothetical protein BC939DRAFT_441255 [Gamsiella multidivaricata]|uniref:uncharacterized protein n=1 Tax=Gamsiella multidivaricata TaxID=101098 RepID=UPI00221E7DC0|nr:uncharacterized protein BC939DRAFT_441255 [Gamsiella multidivaricata]KAI7829619.1 hypothetical protein BC939DRAFT_441255 [Gamsiella multidivaricata]